MKHLDILHDPSRAGDAVADARARLDTTAFRAAVAATAARFAAAGIGRGDVVATVLTNRVELVVALYAAWDLGAVLTPINPALTPDEIAYQLTDGDVRLAVVEAATAGKVTVDSIDAATLLEPGDPNRLRGAAAPDDLALLIYTSGTTGRPKGVMLDHANIESMTGMLLAQDIFRADDKALLILPLFHVNAIMSSVVVPLSVGGSTYIAERFDAQSFWPLVEQERPAFFSAVPAIYLFLTNLPDDVRPDVSSLRLAFCGAAPMPADAVRAFESRYGIPVLEGYGLSESTVALTFNPSDGRRPGTVGKPLGGLEVRVVADDGTPLPVGHDGEVIARGPNIMRGYLNKPAETAAALKDGWLWTGDVGHFDDDGYLVLVDRKKDLIIRGGENISPSESRSGAPGAPERGPGRCGRPSRPRHGRRARRLRHSHSRGDHRRGRGHRSLPRRPRPLQGPSRHPRGRHPPPQRRRQGHQGRPPPAPPRRQLAVTPVAVTTDVVDGRHTLLGMAVAHASTRREPKAVRVGREIHVNVLLLANRSLEQFEAICRTEDLTHSQYVALWTLCLADDADVGIPVSAVSDGLLNRASDTTRLLDRLEKAGLVERLPNPADRRGVLVRATPAGRNRFEAVTPKLQAFHATQWANLTHAEIHELHRLLAKALWESAGEPASP